MYNDVGDVLINDTILNNGSISGSPTKTDLLGGGLFLAYWNGNGSILAKIYDKNLQLVNDTFTLNQQPLQDTTAYNAMLRRIAFGNVVATWQVVGMGNDPRPVYMAILNPQGHKLLNDTEITGFTGGFFNSAYTAPFDSGDFLIVLADTKSIDNNNNFNVAIMGIGYYANGTVKHNLFKIGNDTFNEQIAPKAKILPNNSFAVFWRTVNQIYYRIYNSNFLPITDILNLTTTSFFPIFSFDVNAIDSYGIFLGVWDGYLPNRTDSTAFGQFVYPNGSLLGPYFEIDSNPDQDATEQDPAITTFANEDSNIFISYSSRPSLGDNDIYFQQFKLILPTLSPTTQNPTSIPSQTPTNSPTLSPSVFPTQNPTQYPSITPTAFPTFTPSVSPTQKPSVTPTSMPTGEPSITPSMFPTKNPTELPSYSPTVPPTMTTSQPSISPTFTYSPTKNPTEDTVTPTLFPTNNPSITPTLMPSVTPTKSPSLNPSISPSVTPSKSPTDNPTKLPSNMPSIMPSLNPSKSPTDNPTKFPSNMPSIMPSLTPSKLPTTSPTKYPSLNPSATPTVAPSKSPTDNPTKLPSRNPSATPTRMPSVSPSKSPTDNPTKFPSNMPSVTPTISPTDIPTFWPTNNPSDFPTTLPTLYPTMIPTESPSPLPLPMEEEEKFWTLENYLYILLAGGGGCLLLTGLTVLGYHKMTKKKQHDFSKATRNLELTNPESNSIGNIIVK